MKNFLIYDFPLTRSQIRSIVHRTKKNSLFCLLRDQSLEVKPIKEPLDRSSKGTRAKPQESREIGRSVLSQSYSRLIRMTAVQITIT